MQNEEFNWQAKLAQRVQNIEPSAIRAMAKHLGKPGVISFAAGAPNPKLFPFIDIKAAAEKILTDPIRRQQALQYGPSEGYLPLREFIAEMLASPQLNLTAQNIIITNGAQQALDFIAKVFIDKDDRIITGSPTYIGALQAFSQLAPQIIGIPIHGSGFELDSLEQELHKGAKFIYLMPDHSNPTGMCLSLADRHAVLDLAVKYSTPIIEDQAYDQLQLSGNKLPTLLSLASQHPGNPQIIYLGTFSKSLMPGLRVGWIAAPAKLNKELVCVKQASDLNSSPFCQMIVHDVAREILTHHVVGLLDDYRKRRDTMLTALKQHMPEGVEWTTPDGGMFIWLTLPEQFNSQNMQARIFNEEKVIYVSGATFFPDKSGVNTLRLSYSLNSIEDIAEGIRRLSRSLARIISEVSEVA